ncbi:receptor-like protein EIX2 [Ziziphus jujuba]|uniref:Receptor-like protein EIX2 n=1 Tax=Ziziphus jujuba TaxID=326968 RepID=A0A6P4A181_ZIZJJ|nr:receptor-like protein EIX2 [Ziziphus jujuba]XP_060671435.1 receptor-like protein EIX2 [Ziziphus jujuba]
MRSNKFNGSIPLSLCGLTSLQILDLSQNSIFGNIPQCLSKLTSMHLESPQGTKGDVDGLFYIFINRVPNNMINGSGTYLSTYANKAEIANKGFVMKLRYISPFVKIMDLSGNKLTGKIPEELSSLSELVVLILSRNDLSGELPQDMGEMGKLESLDLCQNRLSGRIPMSMLNIFCLEYLNLSYNNLYGRIPLGGQFATFEASAYIGNQALCGPPLTENCPIEATSNRTRHGDDEFKRWFKVGMGMGFFIGFWGIFGSLCLNRTWRHAYFLFLYKVKDWVLLRLALYTARLQTSCAGLPAGPGLLFSSVNRNLILFKYQETNSRAGSKSFRWKSH